MRNRAAHQLREHAFRCVLLALLGVSTLLLQSCHEPPQPKLVPLSEAQPLMTYQNSSPRFSLKAFMYAPGNLQFRVENLLSGFDLEALPDITSATGRIIQARLAEDNTIEFNLLLPDDGYVRSENDVTIPWALKEKGPGAFLRSEGQIRVDIASGPDMRYFVKAVTYVPASDSPFPQPRAGQEEPPS